MADGHQTDAWNHTAALLAMLANTHRDPKKTRAFKPSDFHPETRREKPKDAPPKVDISVLKTVFVDRP
jgi:hypothetical protein